MYMKDSYEDLQLLSVHPFYHSWHGKGIIKNWFIWQGKEELKKVKRKRNSQ